MILQDFHSFRINGLEGGVAPIRACKSDHFVSIVLSVKNNVGHPTHAIISVISLL
jgi:hypothetical protein